LEIGFGLHPVALHLGVAGHALILFQQLGGIAALPVVLAIAGSGIVAARRSTAAAAATAPAAALTIVDQTKILTKGGTLCPYRPGPSRPPFLRNPGGEGRNLRLQPPLRKNRSFASDKQSGVGTSGLTHPLL
jgi:hypothetical protein